MNTSEEDSWGRERSQWIKQEARWVRWSMLDKWMWSTAVCEAVCEAALWPRGDKKVGRPSACGVQQPLWGKKASISVLHELLRYWPTASKIYRRVVRLSFRISRTLHLVRLSIFLSFLSLLAFYFTPFFPLSFLSFRFSLLRQRDHKSEHKQRRKKERGR